MLVDLIANCMLLNVYLFQLHTGMHFCPWWCLLRHCHDNFGNLSDVAKTTPTLTVRCVLIGRRFSRLFICSVAQKVVLNTCMQF